MLGIDNTVARSQINRLTSSDPFCRWLLARLMKVKKASINTRFLFSEDNVSDSPSRGEELNSTRWNSSWKILSGEYVYTYRYSRCKRRNQMIRVIDACDLEMEGMKKSGVGNSIYTTSYC